MSTETTGILFGGLLPAVLLGTFSILQKASVNAGTRPGMLLLISGVSTLVVGLVFSLVLKDWRVDLRGGAFAFASGILWSTATGLILCAMAIWKAPISRLVPLFNMNTLVAVVLGLLLFQEWRTVRTPQLLIAALLIVIGGTLAATA